MGHLELVLGALLVILALVLLEALVYLVAWRPYAMTRRFTKQGLRGPKYKFWSGCLQEIRSLKISARETEMDIHSHDVVPRVLPHYAKWIPQYGETFFYWFGTKARVCINDAEQVKQILSNKSGFFVKTKPTASVLALLGRGLVVIEGSDWARHRRVVTPAFNMDKLKLFTKKMADCTLSMLDSWHGRMVQEGCNDESSAIEVNGQFEELTADVISHAAFGRDYKDGKEVFLAQKELQMHIIATFLDIQVPGYKYLPTKRNRQIRKLDREIKNTLLKIIQNRLDSKHDYGDDLLGLMMESTRKEEGMALDMDETIDECKTFFLAGHETTSHLLTWTMFLLSTNQEWQERLREEVIGECGSKIPCADSLNKLKLVTMVLLEALRLYSPVNVMSREAAKDMKLGSLTIPKNTEVMLPIAIIHRNKELWGDDADKFNPRRFENGLTKAAKHPNALLAFSVGPRACIGQNFAMLEAKLVIALILQRFSFSISSHYKHKPADMLTLQPESGLPIVFKTLPDVF